MKTEDIRLLIPFIPVFREIRIGPRVLNVEQFCGIAQVWLPMQLPTATKDEQFKDCQIELPKDVFPFVSTGVGRRSQNMEDYVFRLRRRTEPTAFLKRSLALPPVRCVAMVYAVEDYKTECRVYEQDEDQLSDESLNGFTHILCGVGIYSELGSPLPDIHGFVANLSTKRAKDAPWKQDPDQIRDRAKKVHDFERKYCRVAD